MSMSPDEFDYLHEFGEEREAITKPLVPLICGCGHHRSVHSLMLGCCLPGCKCGKFNP